MLPSDTNAYLAFQRFGLGARRGDFKVVAEDPRGALLVEIADPNATRIDDPTLLPTADALKSHYVAVSRKREFKKVAAAAAREKRAADGMTPKKKRNGEDRMMAGADEADADQDMAGQDMGGQDMGGGMGGEDMPGRKGGFGKIRAPDDPAYRAGRVLYNREIEVRFEIASKLRVGFSERLVDFWSNHFTVEADKGQRMRAMIGCFEREAIRPHVLGRFRDMLFAAMKHPAMLLYLDNYRSVGPKSIYGVGTREGLNENLAREAMELHTIGVDGGYTQADVTNFARVLTGWTIFPLRDPETPGEFYFSAMRHEPGAKTVLGQTYEPNGVHQGEAVLDALARHPATARHVARRFATSFVADTPPPALVDRLAKVFQDTDGDLAALARALVEADESWSTPPGKLRSPREFVVAATRCLNLDFEGRNMARVLKAFGQEPWNPTSPQGFAITSADWLAPDAMTNRLDFAELAAGRASADIDPRPLVGDLFGDTVSRDTREAVERAESPRQGLALLLMSPEFQRR
jgi:uncharacterized protein (DUF1800 family)